MFKNLFYGFMNKVRLVVTIIVAFFIVAGICGVLGMNGMNSIPERLVMLVFTLICGMVMYLIVYYWYGKDYKCPSCNKRFCLKKTGEEVAKRENVSVLVETNTRNRNGDVIGSQEQYVPGERIMTLEEYSNLVEKAFGIKNWNYSKKNSGDKTVFTINFSEDGRDHTKCKVFVHNNGICDMEAAFPFNCPEDSRVELCYTLTEYNFSKRYATIRLDLSDGDIINSYSFDMLPSMTPEFVLKKFLGVKDIEKEIYDTVVKTCKQDYLEEKKVQSESSATDKKNKFKIDL